MRTAAFITFAGLLLTLRVADAQAPLTDPDSYAVYNAIIPSSWLLRSGHAKELLIQDTTRLPDPTGKYCSPEGPDLIGPWAVAVANMKKENSEPKALQRQFALPVPYRLLSKETFERRR